MARLALGGISPEYAKIYEGLTGKPDATINVGLEPQSQDGILEGLARQTIQPYRPGWAALPGVAASIVGGMAANELNNRRRARDRADDKLFRDQMGGGSQAAPYVPPKVSAPASPAPTTVATYTKPTTVGEQSDADERRILQQNGVIPAPPSTAPGAQIAGSDLAGEPQQDSRANWNNGQVQLGGDQVPSQPAQPAQNPLLGKIQAKKEEMRRIVAQNPNITASQRQTMLARMQKLEALEAQVLQGEYQYQRGEPDRQLSRRVKEAQLERSLRERQHPTVQLYEAAKASGFDGSLMDFLERQRTARSAPETTIDKEIAKARIKDAATALKGYPSMRQAVGILDQLDKVAQDPNVDGAIGPGLNSQTYQNIVGGMVPFSEALGLANRKLYGRMLRLQKQLEVLGGQNMRGLGAQSDADAARLQEALAGLTSARDGKELQFHLGTIREFVTSGRDRAMAVAEQFPQLGQQYPGLIQDMTRRQQSAPSKIDPNVALDEARKAIAAGAPRDKVIERLQQNGIEPRGL
jgi:hypothetical protein